jgi:hypothetical protein
MNPPTILMVLSIVWQLNSPSGSHESVPMRAEWGSFSYLKRLQQPDTEFISLNTVLFVCLDACRTNSEIFVISQYLLLSASKRLVLDLSDILFRLAQYNFFFSGIPAISILSRRPVYHFTLSPTADMSSFSRCISFNILSVSVYT